MGVGPDGQPLPFACASAGSSRLVAHSRLASFREEVLRGNTLIFTAKLTTSMMEGVQDLRAHVTVPPKALAADLGLLLTSAEGADVKFLCGEATFLAHRVICSVRSPALRAMLAGPAKGAVVIADTPPVVFQALLRYVYTEELEEDPSAELVQHLLARHRGPH